MYDEYATSVYTIFNGLKTVEPVMYVRTADDICNENRQFWFFSYSTFSNGLRQQLHFMNTIALIGKIRTNIRNARESHVPVLRSN